MDKLMPVFCNRYQWYADVGNFREITFQVPILITNNRPKKAKNCKKTF